MSEGQASAQSRAPVGRPLLSLTLAALMDEVHAHSGAVYLLSPDQPVLEMAVMAGLPRAFAAPWERVGLSAPIPVSDAVRERRLVWVGGEEEMARHYPRIAMVLPYPFSLAALPVATAAKVHGAVFVTWPGSHPPELSDREREHLTAACDRLAVRLERAAEHSLPLAPEPDLLAAPVVGRAAGTLGTVEAARMVSRLPYGLCSLDLHGRIAFANAAASELLGVPSQRLVGAQMWAAVPWLNDPVYEDRYRAALFSQHVTSFVALRPPDEWLSFRLYPSTTGLSVRISRARAVRGDEPRHAPAGDGPGAAGDHHPGAQPGRCADRDGRRAGRGAAGRGRDRAGGGQPGAGRARLPGRPAAGAGAPRVRGPAGRGAVRRDAAVPGHPGRAGAALRRARLLRDPGELERLYPALQTHPSEFSAWAYLPLIASGRPVGTCVLSYAAPHHFTTEERAVLTSLAGLIAQALERAMLYDVKHRLAHGLQEALLPHTLPSLPGIEAAARYLPATRGMEIGGDFYDLVPTQGTAAAVIGDVQGHNVTAAGLMGQVRTAVRAYTAVGQAPDEVMRSTNRLLLDLGSELFASCLYLRLDPVRRRAVMSRAGHPPPLLRRPDGRVRVLDLAGGPLLGIDGAAVYPSTEVVLEPGSLLVLYTDGLVESPGTDLEDALADLCRRLTDLGDLPPDDLADALVRHGPRTTDRLDDTAVLLLRSVPVV